MQFMNIDHVYSTSSVSLEATLLLGAKLGALLKGREVIELSSDLGGGKTAFVKGLAGGLGYTGNVISPTFTISKVYPLPHGLELHHFDFYRLADGDVVAAELAEIIGQPDIITAIEWPDTAASVLPDDRLRITIMATGETTRSFTFMSTGPKHQTLINGLQS